MKNWLHKIPVPVCGVALGLAALGNLLQDVSEALRLGCGLLSGLLLALFLLKAALFPAEIAAERKNPASASVAATFPMAVMLLSVYLKPVLGAGAAVLWGAAVLLHLALIVWFTLAFVVHLQMPRVFASYYIVYVGIATAGVTAPAYGMQALGAACFWFGFFSFLALLALVSVRYSRYPQMPEPARPLICIYAAPASLCTAAYVQSVTPKSLPFLLALYAVASILYLFSLVRLARLWKLPFYPSYASYTFPFVISAIASKQTMACAAKMGLALPWLGPVVWVETGIAALLVAYVVIRFAAWLCASAPAPNPAAPRQES